MINVVNVIKRKISMLYIKRYSHKDSMSEEEKAVRRGVLNPSRLATTPKEEVAALKGDKRFHLEPVGRREKRLKRKAQQAKGKGFTKPISKR